MITKLTIKNYSLVIYKGSVWGYKHYKNMWWIDLGYIALVKGQIKI